MLKIIMGEEHVPEFMDKNKFIGYAPACFKGEKKKEWFTSDLVHRILKSIDHVVMDGRLSVYKEDEDVGFSVDELAGGTQSLIAANYLRDDVLLICMGDNCNDFLEEIAVDYEKEGKDLLIVSNYLNEFNFKYVKEILYVNWNIIAKSKHDIRNKVFPLWWDDQALDIDQLYKEFYEEMGVEYDW